MQVSAPDSYLVERYLEEIARTYDIPWRSNIIEHEEDDLIQDLDVDEDDDNSSGGGGIAQKEVIWRIKTKVGVSKVLFLS